MAGALVDLIVDMKTKWEMMNEVLTATLASNITDF